MSESDSNDDVKSVDYENLHHSWLEYWQKHGEVLILSSWIAKYNDYVIKNQNFNQDKQIDANGKFSDQNDQSVNEKAVEDLSSNEIYDDIWKALWETHCEEEYSIIYRKFCQDFYKNEKFVCDENKNSEEHLDLIAKHYTLEISSEQENQENEKDTIQYTNTCLNESDALKLKQLGLPTSFGCNNEKLNIMNPKEHNKCRTENLSEDSNEMYTSAGEGSLQDENSFLNTNIESLVENKRRKNKNKKNKKIKNKKIKNKLECEIPKEIHENRKLIKYWYKRYSLFSLFDCGIKLDEESWFSVTPEKIAVNIAERLKCDVVIDAFCGCGGNTIQLARTCNRVISIDIDPKKIEYAKHNAKIYGVENKIDFIVGDFFKINANLKSDCIFLSPPWGGPAYLKNENYDIEKDLQPVSASELFEISRRITDNIAIYLPKNSNNEQIINLIGAEGKTVEIVKNYLNNKIIALTAFYGNLIPLK